MEESESRREGKFRIFRFLNSKIRKQKKERKRERKKERKREKGRDR